MNLVLACALAYCAITLVLQFLGWAWTRATCRLVLRDWRIARRDIWPGRKVELTGTPLCGHVALIYTHPDKPAQVLVDEIWNANTDDSEDCPLATVLAIGDVERLARETWREAIRRLRADRKVA